MSSEKLKAVLVDDEDLVRSGLKEWLERVAHIQVVGEASSGEECFSLVESLTPDVLITDIKLPGISGIEIVRRLSEAGGKLKSVVLSASVTPELVLDAFHAGALAFVPKGTQVEELSVALSHACKGNWYLSPFITRDFVEYAAEMRVFRSKDKKAVVGGVALTDPERELLKLVAEGNTFNQIGQALEINTRAVERLKAKVEEKLESKTLADLIRQAIRLGIIEA